MKPNKTKQTLSLRLLMASSLLLLSIKVMAAPGTLADLPLQTSSSTEGNIVFLLDDSNSMDSFLSGSSGPTRWDSLETAMSTILSNLSGVNVGLATFDTDKSGNGGDIVYDLTLLDTSLGSNAATLTAMNSVITGLGGALGGNSTIPAESLQDIGRYFANNSSGQCGGAANAELTIHPGGGVLEDNIRCTSLLGDKARIKARPEATTASCQKNFVVLMSDGLTSRDYTLRSAAPDNFTTPSSAAADHPFWDYDQDCTAAAQTAGSYGCGTSSTKARDNKVSGTKDYTYHSNGNGTDYLDDVAQALYDIDLRPDYPDYKNNVTTYTVGFAADALDPASSDYNPLLQSAAEQAGGEYFFATDTASLDNAFSEITAAVIDQTSTSSAVTFNSSTLSSQSAVYQALFNTSRWGGELRSIPLDGFTGDIDFNCTSGSNNCWYATTQLEGQSASTTGQLAGGRSIITYNPTSNSGVAFQMPSDYTTLDVSGTSDAIPLAMMNDFCGQGIPNICDAATAADATKKAANQGYLDAMTDYFRGDRTEEGITTTHQFRVRSSKLGDLVDSSPVFVGEPSLNWPDSGVFPQVVTSYDFRYSTWKTSSVKNRAQVVYVGSNDGLLHGFRTEESATSAGDAGEEVLAYIPTGILSATNNEGLHYLADRTYSHKYYNDLTPTVSDVYMKYRTTGGALASTDDVNDRAWRTVLLGGLRGGGRSLYLLDVTDPTKFLESKADELVMWEFAHNDLGYTYSKPTIAMMNNGKFAAIFGNGYKSGEDGGSGDCRAKLFVVYLEGGLDGNWTTAGDYELYDTATGSVPDGTIGNADDDYCNGLSTPAVVDLDGNGTADRVYAGDLKGNLWTFDVCKYTSGACATSGWGIANASPMMIATDASSNRQPITVKPIVARDPTSAGSDDVIVIFGTGQYITEADKLTIGSQGMYAIRDEEALTNGRSAGGGDGWSLSPRGGGTKFVAQTIAENLACAGTCTVRTISANAVASNKVGWFIDLPTSGERVAVNPKIRSNVVFFNTLIPSSVSCASGGSGWLMSVDLATGGAPPKVLFDADGDGTIGNAGDYADVGGTPTAPAGRYSDVLPAESTFLGKYQYTPGSDGGIAKDELDLEASQREGRMSWRELYEDDD